MRLHPGTLMAVVLVPALAACLDYDRLRGPDGGVSAVRNDTAGGSGPPHDAPASPTPHGPMALDGPNAPDAPTADGAATVTPPDPDAAPADAAGSPPDASDGPLPSPDEGVSFGCPDDPDLRACYRFDEDEDDDTLVDGSRFRNHGMRNSAARGVGIRGGSLQFSDGLQFALCPDGPALKMGAAPVTIEAWIRPTSSDLDDVSDVIAAKWTRVHTGFLLGGLGFDLSLQTSSATTDRRRGGKFNPNVWSHVAAVITASAVELYIDGTRVHTGPGLTLPENREPLVIGNANPATSDVDPGKTAFRGDIDVLRIWTRAKSERELCTDADREWVLKSCGPRTAPGP